MTTEPATPAVSASSAPETVDADFEVTSWRQPEEEGGTRAYVSKTFRGPLAGTSEAELLMAGGEDGRGYIANEVFSGTLNGRRGTVVFQHGGIDDGSTPFTYGYIVPGTGTGELAGLTGRITFAHDESGARVRLVLGS